MTFQLSIDGKKSAHISDCGKYRYFLTREWDKLLPSAKWIMLNPSTADATLDDPTIRKCIGFAKAWGCGGIQVMNLFAWRATNPKELPRIADPVGPENDKTLWFITSTGSGPIVAAWGTHGTLHQRDQAVMKLLKSIDVKCLGTTKDGHPKHPLYVPYDAPLVTFTPSKASALTQGDAK